MMGSKFYKSVKTNAVAELVGKTEHGVILLLEDGDERILATSTLTRWWKELEKPPEQRLEKLKTDTIEDTTVKKVNVTVETVDKLTGNHKDFVNATLKLTENVGSTVFIRVATGDYNIINNNTIYLWFRLTKNDTITVFVKSKAVGMDFGHTRINHNFDVKVTFNEMNMEAYKLLNKLHDLSLVYQTNKKLKK